MAILLPPLLFPAKTKADEAWLLQLKKQKLIRKIGPRLYTSVPKKDEASLVRSQWAQIINELYPNTLLSFRTALEYLPSPENRIILTSVTNRKVEYPGLSLHFVRGPSVRNDDLPFLDFHASSLARAYLENLSSTKVTAWRSLSQTEIEERLEILLQAKGEAGLNQLRDQAKQIAKDLKWMHEFKKLDKMIGALLGSRSVKSLKSPLAQARGRQKPFDIERVHRFDLLFAILKSTPLIEIPEKNLGAEHFRNKAFFDSYFSNYIEGTTFEIEEAEEIIFDHKIPKDRPKDAHDILGTFNIVSDLKKNLQTPSSAAELESILKERHSTLMNNRPEAMPGRFKIKPNRAGNTYFVDPTNISGTLEQAFQRYQNLPLGLARAVYLMFVISEIHPFVDGNGRISRILMNAELHSAGLTTIIIPNVYREDYLSGLRALTRRDRPDPILRMLTRAHKFSSLNFNNYQKVLAELLRRNWFAEAVDAKLIE